MNNVIDLKLASRDVEQEYSATEFAAALRQLADSIERGEQIEVQVAGETIVIPDGSTFSVEHERGEDGEELEFQIKWSHPIEAEAVEVASAAV